MVFTILEHQICCVRTFDVVLVFRHVRLPDAKRTKRTDSRNKADRIVSKRRRKTSVSTSLERHVFHSNRGTFYVALGTSSQVDSPLRARKYHLHTKNILRKPPGRFFTF